MHAQIYIYIYIYIYILYMEKSITTVLFSTKTNTFANGWQRFQTWTLTEFCNYAFNYGCTYVL